MPNWTPVEEALKTAKSIAFDGCHKIYLNMDAKQTAEMRSYGYGTDEDSYLLPVYPSPRGRAIALATLQTWYKASCGLEFVNAVSTVDGDPNEGFVTLIEQGADDEGDDL